MPICGFLIEYINWQSTFYFTGMVQGRCLLGHPIMLSRKTIVNTSSFQKKNPLDFWNIVLSANSIIIFAWIVKLLPENMKYIRGFPSHRTFCRQDTFKELSVSIFVLQSFEHSESERGGECGKEWSKKERRKVKPVSEHCRHIISTSFDFFYYRTNILIETKPVEPVNHNISTIIRNSHFSSLSLRARMHCANLDFKFHVQD